MEEKYNGKYRIASNRLRGWDYSCSGHYFITFVTAGRKKLFGEIINGEMLLNDLGQIVHDEFFKSFELRKELFLGEFVLMPDHLHAIVILDKSKCEHSDHVNTNVTNHMDGEFIPQRKPKSISSFISGFKSSTIKQIDDWIDLNHLTIAKFNKKNPLWQPNYHDHIIRNETEYRNISKYIIRNPIEWEKNNK